MGLITSCFIFSAKCIRCRKLVVFVV